MAQLEKITGLVSGVNRSSEITGHVNRGQGNIHTKQVLTFRVGGRPVEIKLMTQPSLQDGEMATVVGKNKKGTLHSYALRNDQTGAVYHQPIGLVYAIGAFLLILGLLTLIILIGVVLLGLGIANLWLARTRSQALKLLLAD